MHTSENLIQAIEKGLPGSEAIVRNPRGDSEHFIAEVYYEGFEGKSLVEQHRMVYEALKTEFAQGMHSLSLKTKVRKNG